MIVNGNDDGSDESDSSADNLHTIGGSCLHKIFFLLIHVFYLFICKFGLEGREGERKNDAELFRFRLHQQLIKTSLEERKGKEDAARKGAAAERCRSFPPLSFSPLFARREAVPLRIIEVSEDALRQSADIHTRYILSPLSLSDTYASASASWPAYVHRYQRLGSLQRRVWNQHFITYMHGSQFRKSTTKTGWGGSSPGPKPGNELRLPFSRLRFHYHSSSFILEEGLCSSFLALLHVTFSGIHWHRRFPYQRCQ